MPESGSSGSFLDAAVAILETADRPLTANEILAHALERGLIQPTGKTPLASMTARLYVHIRDARQPRVQRVFEPGRARAQRGSVRWVLAQASD
jgi:hypothetical protein